MPPLIDPEPMPEGQAPDPLPSAALRPDRISAGESRQARLKREIQRAGEQAQQVAYAELRDQVRMELGAPSEPSRGTGDCLALVLVPLGLILMLVHPAPAIAVWVMAGCLYLEGSNRMKRERAEIRAADSEAERRWRHQQARATNDDEDWALTVALRPPEPPRPAGSEPRHPG